MDGHYPATMHGLNEWTKAEFEKLGWMVLAKKYGNIDKVKVYVKSIDHLLTSLNDKIAEFSKMPNEQGRVSDLNVLKSKVEILKTHVMSDFADVMKGGKKNKKNNDKDN